MNYYVLQKPVSLLASGVVAMVVSCLIFLGLITCISREVYTGEKQHLSNSSNSKMTWCLEEGFILGVVLILVMSMGSSSMIEEEQYIWNFVICTLYLLLLRKAVQSPSGRSGSALLLKAQNRRSDVQVCAILLLLISARLLRGWHQGGVNWTHLPDISKWLEQGGSNTIRLVQLTSGLLMMSLGLFALFLFVSKTKLVQVVGFFFLISGFLVLWHIMEYQDNALVSSNYRATLLAQIIYATLGIGTMGTVIALPWLMPIQISSACSKHKTNSSTSVSFDIQYKFPLVELRDSSYLIGLVYMLCWCLLQLLLQQPINSMPIFLLLMQILTNMLYCSYNRPQNKEWLEVSSFTISC